MVELVPREASGRLACLLARAPAVGLTGPRQVGKTTAALEFVRGRNGAYLDLEDPRDSAKLADVHKYCKLNANRLVVLDEIHRIPGLFEPLRRIIDRRRRESRRAGHFLLLGSASIDLLRQTGETLAGRVAYCEMQPLNVREAGRLLRRQNPSSNRPGRMAYRRRTSRDQPESRAHARPWTPALWFFGRHGCGHCRKANEKARFGRACDFCVRFR